MTVTGKKRLRIAAGLILFLLVVAAGESPLSSINWTKDWQAWLGAGLAIVAARTALEAAREQIAADGMRDRVSALRSDLEIRERFLHVAKPFWDFCEAITEDVENPEPNTFLDRASTSIENYFRRDLIIFEDEFLRDLENYRFRFPEKGIPLVVIARRIDQTCREIRRLARERRAELRNSAAFSEAGIRHRSHLASEIPEALAIREEIEASCQEIKKAIHAATSAPTEASRA